MIEETIALVSGTLIAALVSLLIYKKEALEGWGRGTYILYLFTNIAFAITIIISMLKIENIFPNIFNDGRYFVISTVISLILLMAFVVTCICDVNISFKLKINKEKTRGNRSRKRH